MRTKIVMLPCLTLLTLLAVPACADWDCDETAPREASIAVDGATLIEIEARAGSLEIEGRAGLREVHAHGEACADRASALDEIQIVTRRSGDRVSIIVEMPDSKGWGNTAALDLVVEVPDDVPLQIQDSSGSLTLRNAAAARIEDSSGGMRIEGVRGDLSIDDSSGEIEVTDVGGEVRIRDSSGEIEVRQVGRSVIVEQDSSGSIDIRQVEGDVVVERDSSGSINAEEVGGDFTVKRDGSGGIDYRNVRGRVSTPEDR